MEKKSPFHFNAEKILQIIFMICFYVYVLKILQSGLSAKIINPKFNIYLIASLVFLFAAIPAQVRVIHDDGGRGIIKFKYLIFAVMLMLIYNAPLNNIDQDIADLRGVNIGNDRTLYKNDSSNTATVRDNDNKVKNEDKDINSADADTYNMEKSGSEKSEEKKDLREEPPVEIDTGNYFIMLDAIFTNPDRFEGRIIKIKGFVFIPKSGEFPEKVFAAGRLAIMCCAADATVVGILCRIEDRSVLREREWYEITGILRKAMDLNGESSPYIEVTDYRYLQKHDDDYIYYNR